MAYSHSEFGEERVGNFVMSLIGAVSPSGSSRSFVRGNKGVSRNPVPSSPSPTLTTKSQSSQELVEDTLGSLTTLLSISSSSSEFRQGADGTVTVVTKSNRGKLHTKKKENYPPRKNILRKKRSLLKALSPEDLGRVSKSPPPHETFPSSLPSVVVTVPTASSSPSPQEKYFNDKGEKITTATKNHHPATVHSRKTIPNSINNSRGNSNGSSNNNNNRNSHTNFSLSNHQKQKSETEIATNSDTIAGDGTTIKNISKRMAGQRSPNYTDSKRNPGSLQLLHNNSNIENDNAGVISASQDKMPLINNKEEQRQEQRDNGSGNNTKATTASTTNSKESVDKQCCTDEVAYKEMRQEVYNHADDCHGRMCIHHHHHHSHHHHYHYYDSNSDQKKSFRGQRHHHHNHSIFNTSNDQGDATDMGLDQLQQNPNNGKVEKLSGNNGSIPQQQHYLHNHRHTTIMMIQNDAFSSSPAEKPPKPPPPSHDYSHDDISFYRKFSATSPLQNLASRHRRSKSSLAWPTMEAQLYDLNCIGGNKGSRSKKQKQKSRSTPVSLDAIGLAHLPDSIKSTEPILKLSPGPIYNPYGYGCKCGGCLYCCNELACDCCCDECCCARQFSHVSTSLTTAAEGEKENPESESGIFENGHNNNDATDHNHTSEWEKQIPQQHENTSPKNRLSRSVESILSLFSNDLLVLDDDDPDSFINAHLLRHLELYESEEDDEDGDEEEEEREQQDGPNLSTNNSDQDDNDHTNTKMQSVSIAREKTSASKNDHQKDSIDAKSFPAVVEKVRENSGSSPTATTAVAEPILSRRNSYIVIPKETPTRSPVHRHEDDDDDSMKNSGGGMSGSRRRQNPSPNSTVLRTANGEIRYSPITPSALRQPSSSTSGNPNEKSRNNGGALAVDEQTRRNAVMTVTVDTMSLFLDAVHLQMNQG